MFSTSSEDCPYQVGLVTDSNGISEGSFGGNAWQGLLRAREELNVCVEFLVSGDNADIVENMALFSFQGMDMIVAAGFNMADAVAASAELHPDIDHVIVDFAFDPPISNVQAATFEVDQAAFLAGYLAAESAHSRDADDPQAGFLGGVEIPPVQQFLAGYEAGVEYYNTREWGADRAPDSGVRVPALYAGTFTEPGAGFEMAQVLIAEGVDVLFVAAGPTGLGALAAVRERGIWGIGVDVDQYYSLPEEGSILLTSVLKRLDNAVFQIVAEALAGDFHGGEVLVGTLENDGVGLAPFHDFEDQIPVDVREALENLEEAIIDGQIDTGW
jgi:basic membrane protein A